MALVYSPSRPHLSPVVQPARHRRFLVGGLRRTLLRRRGAVRRRRVGFRLLLCPLFLLVALALTSAPEAAVVPASRTVKAASGAEAPADFHSLVPGAASVVVARSYRNGDWLTAECSVGERAFRNWAKARQLTLSSTSVAQVPEHSGEPGDLRFQVLTFVRDDRLLVHEARRDGRIFRLVYDRHLRRLYSLRS